MTGRRSGNRCHEEGAVTAYAASIAFVLVIAGLVITQVAGLVRLRHEVSAAADLAALAASQASVAGRDACEVGEDIARRNGTTLVACRMDFDVATVSARASSPTWWDHRWAFEQEARAAPASYLDPGAPASSASSSATAPALSSGSLPLPHLGEWTQDGHPVAHSHATIASRVTWSQRAAIS